MDAARHEDDEAATNRPIVSGAAREPGGPTGVEVKITFRLERHQPSQAPRLW
jgi:hypothetical protein